MLGVLPPSVVAQPNALGTWRILSPRPSQVVQADEVVIVARLDGPSMLDASSVELLLDGQAVTAEALVIERRVSFVPARPLDAGVHDVVLRARTADGTALPAASWRFEVAGADGPTPVQARDAFELRGYTLLSTRGSDVAGLGSPLRQEPPSTHIADVDLVGRYRGVEFPIRLYLTSDASSSLQPRNRLLLGVRAGRSALLFGDASPTFSPLVYGGARLRGVHGTGRLGMLQVEAAHGQLRRGLEGRLIGALPPVPVTPDPLVPGPFGLSAYRRTMTAARVAVGRERSLLVSLHALRAQDHAGTLRPGISPQENVVGGGDAHLRLWRQRIRLRAGAAFSVFTQDAARGPLSQAEADSILGIDLPFDPVRFRRIITLNASTVPLSAGQLSEAVAWFAEGDVRVGTHRLRTAYRSVGSAFYSVANPFMQTGRRRFEVEDRFQLLARRLSGSLRYRRETSPRTEGGTRGLDAHLASGQLTVAPRRGPRLFAGGQVQRRDRASLGREGEQQTRLFSINAGGFYGFRTGGVRHTLNVFWTHTARDDQRPGATGTIGADNTTRVLSAGLAEQFDAPLDVSVQVTRLSIDTDALGRLQGLTTLRGRLGYRPRTLPVRSALTVENVHAAQTTFVPASDRTRLAASARYTMRQRMEAELEVGVSRYRERGMPDRAYDERYVVLRHRYRF